MKIHCLKCKHACLVNKKSARVVKVKGRGREIPMLKAKCAECDNKVCRILSKENAKILKKSLKKSVRK